MPPARFAFTGLLLCLHASGVFSGGVSRRAVLYSASAASIGPVRTEEMPSIVFYDAVTRDSCLQLQERLLSVEAASLDSGLPIELHIQSEGGSLLSALHICDIIESMRAPVHTFVEGCAASAASLIAVCGERRYIGTHSVMLLHQASVTLPPLKHADLEDEEYNLSMLSRHMVDLYVRHSKMSASQVRRTLIDERYLSAKDCVRFGLADAIQTRPSLSRVL